MKARISVVKCFLYSIVLSITFVTILPLYWMMTGSLKKMEVTMKVPPDLFPVNPVLDNYRILFSLEFNALRWLFNSIITASCTTIICILACSMMGYVFAKKDFLLRNIMFISILATLMFPKQTAIVPLYLTIKDMGLLNNYMGIIFPTVAWPLGVFLMRQFMYGIPDSLIEAARIDGASEIWIFIKTILPLSKPAIASLGILVFMFTWGDFIWQLIILKEMRLWTVNIGISVISKMPVGNASLVNYGLAMAGGTFGAMPVIIMFIAFQRNFIKGIVMGALKE